MGRLARPCPLQLKHRCYTGPGIPQRTWRATARQAKLAGQVLPRRRASRPQARDSVTRGGYTLTDLAACAPCLATAVGLSPI
jgi:hypothetical protein